MTKKPGIKTKYLIKDYVELKNGEITEKDKEFHPGYNMVNFFDGRYVLIKNHKDDMNAVEINLNSLINRIEKLEKPWWKRIF